jgi:hypothetical protein
MFASCNYALAQVNNSFIPYLEQLIRCKFQIDLVLFRSDSLQVVLVKEIRLKHIHLKH